MDETIDERTALGMLANDLEAAGDDAAVLDDLVITTDMLHERTDFPEGTTRYTAGWRSIGASLSDVAAMGAAATATVAAYGATEFVESELRAFVRGAVDVCESVGASYVGGDLDIHSEFTLATTAIGEADDPVLRSGAAPGEVVCVTGALGRSAAGLAAFEAGDRDRGNELFRFPPRIETGLAVAEHATAMMDSSDGLARSLHQLAEASDCGFEIDRETVPIAGALDAVADSERERWELATTFGEDFELVCTIPQREVPAARSAAPVELTPIGRAEPADAGVTVDGEPLADRGYTHE